MASLSFIVLKEGMMGAYLSKFYSDRINNVIFMESSISESDEDSHSHSGNVVNISSPVIHPARRFVFNSMLNALILLSIVWPTYRPLNSFQAYFPVTQFCTTRTEMPPSELMITSISFSEALSLALSSNITFDISLACNTVFT